MISETAGWVCRNGHYNDGQLTRTVCVFGWNGGPTFPCGAIRDPRDLYDTPAALGGGEGASDAKGGVGFTSETARESYRRMTFNKKRGVGGFICFRCAEMLSTRGWAEVQQEAQVTGVEQPGNRLEAFATKEDLKWHIKNVHKGKGFADKAVREMRRKSEKGFKER